MKRENKTGTVAKLSGTRRRPYVVREGFSGKHKILAYVYNREEGDRILTEFNQIYQYLSTQNLPTDEFDQKVSQVILKLKNTSEKEQELPVLEQLYDVLDVCPCCKRKFTQHKILPTFQDLYEQWKSEKWERYGNSSKRNFRHSYGFCNSLNQVQFSDITTEQMQGIIDDCGCGYATQLNIKNLFIQLEYFVIEKWGEEIKFSRKTLHLKEIEIPEPKPKNCFTLEEISILWENSVMEWVDTVLFLLYSGVRMEEMRAVQLHNLDFEQNVLSINNEEITLPEKLVELLQKRVGQNSDENSALFKTKTGKPLTDIMYRYLFKSVMADLNINHKIKDCKATFELKLKRTNLDAMLMGSLSTQANVMG